MTPKGFSAEGCILRAAPPRSSRAAPGINCAMTQRLTPRHALEQLTAQPGAEFVTLFRHGSLEVELYRPEKVDRQQPHARDELYVVISGAGTFVKGDRRQPFEPGEVLFVPAGVPHRFEAFSEDFATWVFFYGPEGGEAASNADARET